MTNINNINQQEEFESKLLDLARVVKVTAGGKTLRFRATVAVGNKNGKVGVGVSKGRDVTQAIEKATKKAKKNLIEVKTVNGTIPFDITTKYQSAKLFLKPQKQGRGIIAGGVVRTLCELAGIKDITAKLISKTNNKINIARATLKAFIEITKETEKLEEK
jgi:small subunit ribosomal protein S5